LYPGPWPTGEWLGRIGAALTPQHAPYGVNLILHPSNARLKDDFALCVAHKVPFVITSLGHPGEVADAVHGYGGLVFSDVIHAHHARKAIEAGVDGIVAVASGAGGHAGTQSVFSLIREIPRILGRVLIAGGASPTARGTGRRVAGCRLRLMGTRFNATRESLAQPEYRTCWWPPAPATSCIPTWCPAPTPTSCGRPWKGRLQREAALPGHGKAHNKDLADEARAWARQSGARPRRGGDPRRGAGAELAARLAQEYRAAARYRRPPRCDTETAPGRIAPRGAHSCLRLQITRRGPIMGTGP